MLKFAVRLLAGLAVTALGALVLWGGAGMAMAMGGWDSPPRGTFVDVAGKRMRIVCEGAREPGQPLVVFEAGAYSGSADFGWLQPQVATFARTCSYDRAGMGWSEPTDRPRDPGTLADDLHALLAAAGEPGPYVLVGHSMAGLMTRAFISAHPDEVQGLVLIDAADPSAIGIPEARIWIRRYQRLARLGAGLSQVGLVKPLSPFFANRIGLPDGPALREKHRMFGAPRHMRAAAAEITSTIDGAARAQGADPYLAAIPVAAVTAGPAGEPGRSAWKEAQQRAARLSSQGFAINVDAATHTSILGPLHGPVVVDAIRRVLAAATDAASREAD
jgi:pimeloyl-ACP methyl ester carboxylesterase